MKDVSQCICILARLRRSFLYRYSRTGQTFTSLYFDEWWPE